MHVKGSLMTDACTYNVRTSRIQWVGEVFYTLVSLDFRFNPASSQA